MSDKKQKKALSEPLARENASGSDSGSAIGTRIAEVADALGSNSSLARLCNVSPSVIGKWASGESEPTTSNLVAVARAGGVTVEWLATGALPKRPGQVVSTEDYVAVPLYDIKSVSGQAAFADARPSAQSIMLPKDWPREHAGITSEMLAFIHMYGDAMKPTFNDGDLLLIDRTDTILAKGIYVCFIDGFLFIQRLARVATEIVAFSEDDPARAPSPLPDLKKFSERSGIYGRVIWSGGRV